MFVQVRHDDGSGDEPRALKGGAEFGDLFRAKACADRLAIDVGCAHGFVDCKGKGNLGHRYVIVVDDAGKSLYNVSCCRQGRN